MEPLFKIFEPLASRLYKLTMKSVYVKDFDIKQIMDNIESNLFAYPANEALSEINKYLQLISKLIEKRNYFENFVELETNIITSDDEYGNTCREETLTHVSLPEWKRDSVNSEIEFELKYYSVILNKFKDYLNPNLPTAKKDGNTILKLSYVHFHTNSENLTDLCNSLKKHDFLDTSVNPTDFKNAFGGNKKPKQKIYWKGSLSALYYFIKRLYEVGIIEEKAKEQKWINTKALFCIDGGRDITEDVGRQKNPKIKDCEQIDKLVKALAQI